MVTSLIQANESTRYLDTILFFLDEVQGGAPAYSPAVMFNRFLTFS
jgi:hypothetical protein